LGAYPELGEVLGPLSLIHGPKLNQKYHLSMTKYMRGDK